VPLFTVIIPAYNRESTIAETIKSVLTQEFNDFEILVVDDGSHDRTAEIARSFGIRVIEQTNAGPSAARNLAASHGRGEYFAFLDSDDLWFPWTLALYSKAIKEHNRPALIVGERIDFQHEDELAQVREGELVTRAYDDYLASSRIAPFLSASALVVRADCYLERHGFVPDRVNAEDCDLCLRLGTAGRFVHIESPAMFGYRKHVGSLVGSFPAALAGQRMLIAREMKGIYPGGSPRARERRRILTRHIRPAALEFLRRGEHGAAWELYRATFGWHLTQGRARFLAAFPIMAAWEACCARRPAPDNRLPQQTS
jgi:glycosyltransferase involved in cell wall biosynthesis